jgi:hypothetical protein
MVQQRAATEHPMTRRMAIIRPVRLGLIVVAAAVLAGMAWYLVSPLFVAHRVSEATPPDVEAASVPTHRGSFGEVDAIHKGAGQATFYLRPDGRTVLRLESFEVTNGPDLYVYVSGHPRPRTSTQLHDGFSYEVAVLKGNVGDQNYELPPDLDVSRVKSVVIYCRRFTTVFSTAELQPA